jgi:hypothetical protein
MTERKPHPDNALIDEMEDTSAPDAQSTGAGGNVNRTVGTRAELNAAQGNLAGEEVERATGSDNPAQDEKKGDKTIDAIQQQRAE